MSKFLVPPIYSPRGLENQLKNNIYQSHELICGCNKPKEHLIHLLTSECHRSEDGPRTTGETADVIDTFEDGELEKIFDSPITEDDQG